MRGLQLYIVVKAKRRCVTKFTTKPKTIRGNTLLRSVGDMIKIPFHFTSHRVHHTSFTQITNIIHITNCISVPGMNDVSDVCKYVVVMLLSLQKRMTK